MTEQEATEAFHRAVEASRSAKELLREAEAHYKDCVDSERLAWVAMKDTGRRAGRQ